VLRVSIELPAGYDPEAISRHSVRLAGAVSAIGSSDRLTDADGDGLPERWFYFRFGDVAPLLVGGVNRLRVSGLVDGRAFEGEGTLEVRALDLDVRITPETLDRSAHGGDVRAHIELDGGLRGTDVVLGSLRLQGVVPVTRVVQVGQRHLIVEFDRAQVLARLPNGSRVKVQVTGKVGRVTFVANDEIRVKD
jgi:hypothetical protein